MTHVSWRWILIGGCAGLLALHVVSLSFEWSHQRHWQDPERIEGSRTGWQKLLGKSADDSFDTGEPQYQVILIPSLLFAAGLAALLIAGCQKSTFARTRLCLAAGLLGAAAIAGACFLGIDSGVTKSSHGARAWFGMGWYLYTLTCAGVAIMALGLWVREARDKHAKKGKS
jgi:hypothetical protein